ncbi:hypothetical protein LSUCC0246_06220 [Rhodobacterales bacterium LSUCC0246]|nr:hypothetical protein [Rhodobacterales bacterium LSUCC0374]
MSMQSPIVASDTIPVREIVKDDKTGLILHFLDPEEIPEKAIQLLSDYKPGERLGKAADAHVVKSYDFKTSLPAPACAPDQCACSKGQSDSAAQKQIAILGLTARVFSDSRVDNTAVSARVIHDRANSGNRWGGLYWLACCGRFA